MKNDERWLSHNYYVSYMIMQSNMTMNAQVIKRKRWKLHGNISRNGHGKAIIGRYGGCFEEDIIRLMYDCSDPTRMDQVSVLKCHPWIGMLTHTVLEDL